MRNLPITGNDTVLDAISRLEGIPAVSSKTIWVARPAPGSKGGEQVLPVNWEAIASGGETSTNYQLLPGDRLYLADDSLLAFGNFVDRLVNPVQKLFAFSSLGVSTVQSAQTMGRHYNNVQPQTQP